jgi:hypothetical protein
MGKQVDFVNRIFISNVIKQARLNLRKQGRNVSGRLQSSMRGEVRHGDVTFYFEDYGRQIDTGRLGRVSSPAPQGMFQMVKAGRPPTAPIRQWIQRTNQQPSNGISVASLAYVEARAIGRRGVRGGGFFTKAFNKYYARYTDDLAEAVGDDILEAIKKI